MERCLWNPETVIWTYLVIDAEVMGFPDGVSDAFPGLDLSQPKPQVGAGLRQRPQQVEKFFLEMQRAPVGRDAVQWSVRPADHRGVIGFRSHVYLFESHRFHRLHRLLHGGQTHLSGSGEKLETCAQGLSDYSRCRRLYFRARPEFLGNRVNWRASIAYPRLRLPSNRRLIWCPENFRRMLRR